MKNKIPAKHYQNLIKKAELVISRELDKNSRNTRILRTRIIYYQSKLYAIEKGWRI